MLYKCLKKSLKFSNRGFLFSFKSWIWDFIQVEKVPNYSNLPSMICEGIQNKFYQFAIYSSMDNQHTELIWVIEFSLTISWKSIFPITLDFSLLKFTRSIHTARYKNWVKEKGTSLAEFHCLITILPFIISCFPCHSSLSLCYKMKQRE